MQLEQGTTVISLSQKIALVWERMGVELSLWKHVLAFIVALLTVIVLILVFLALIYVLFTGTAWIVSRFIK